MTLHKKRLKNKTLVSSLLCSSMSTSCSELKESCALCFTTQVVLSRNFAFSFFPFHYDLLGTVWDWGNETWLFRFPTVIWTNFLYYFMFPLMSLTEIFHTWKEITCFAFHLLSKWSNTQHAMWLLTLFRQAKRLNTYSYWFNSLLVRKLHRN